MSINGLNIDSVWMDECADDWCTDASWKVYGSDNVVILSLLNLMQKKGFRYMVFDIKNKRIIDLMIERDYIKCVNLHTKGETIRGNFGIKITGEVFRKLWSNFNAL